MNWKEINKKAVLLFATGKVKRISDDKSNFGEMFEIGDEMENYTVVVKTLSGRTEFTCSCPSGTRFCNSPSVCCHRLAVVLYSQREVFK